MKKIAFLKSRLGHKGGLEKYTRRLANAFFHKGYEVTILTTGEEVESANVNLVSLMPTSKFSLYHLFRFNQLTQKWLKENPQDIVFGMERTTHQTHYRAGSGVHKVFLERRVLTDSPLKRASFKLNPLHQYILHAEKKAFESQDLRLLFTNSHMVRDEILSHYKVSPEKIAVVHNGVEWREWEKDFYETFNSPREGPFHFLFIGHGYRRKGLLFLLRGLSQLKSRDWVLTVVGKDKEPSFFLKEAAELKIKDHISFEGYQKEVLPYYQKADALVIPSIYDPFSNVVLEALAMGLFVVSSKYNGAHEILTNNSGSVMEEITSPLSVAESLEKALERPKTAERGLSIRQSIEELDFANQLDKIVQKTCQ